MVGAAHSAMVGELQTSERADTIFETKNEKWVVVSEEPGPVSF